MKAWHLIEVEEGLVEVEGKTLAVLRTSDCCSSTCRLEALFLPPYSYYDKFIHDYFKLADSKNWKPPLLGKHCFVYAS